jgi:hypothetical protein
MVTHLPYLGHTPFAVAPSVLLSHLVSSGFCLVQSEPVGILLLQTVL